MAVSYNKLWKILIDKGMKKEDRICLNTKEAATFVKKCMGGAK